MKVVFPILVFLFILSSCTHKNEIKVPPHTNIFKYTIEETSEAVRTGKYYGFVRLDSALYYARKEKKNILVVFTCWACSSNGPVEWETLSLYEDKKKLYDNFVIACLYVDDKRDLCDTQTVLLGNRPFKLKTIGNLYSYLQANVFQCNTQPQLAFLDTNLVAYGKVQSWTKNKQDVNEFIESGLKK
jgi:hypothetical protein